MYSKKKTISHPPALIAGGGGWGRGDIAKPCMNTVKMGWKKINLNFIRRAQASTGRVPGLY
jgi:hypothetical protein